LKQILQSLATGETELADVPSPGVSSRTILVRSHASLVSAGTERMLVDFGRSNLLEKARKQPEKVRQVLDKVRTDGLGPTLEAVRSKLDQPIPLGYCQAGVVLEAGHEAGGFAPGDRVVTNGPHAEVVRVPWTLAAKVPDGVGLDAAAFTPLAAIGLQGLRLAHPTLGETVVVFGLGLIGLLTVQLARAAGCRVIGIDRVAERVRMAEAAGALPLLAGDGTDLAAAVHELTGGVGADIVLLTLATDADEPVHQAAVMCRKRGRIVLVGVSGLSLKREDFYQKELSFQVSCSYGPGRYDASHEEGGVDYPLPFVRWTEARNFAAVLELMASGRLNPLPLVTHRFPFAEAPKAYDLVTGPEESLGILLEYAAGDDGDGPGAALAQRTTVLDPSPIATSRAVLGCIGAGNFASRMLVPAFQKGGATLHTVASSGGTTAAVVARKQGFRKATTDVDALLSDPEIDTVAVATRHDSHARLVVEALRAGKHVFVEKPLALTMEEMDQVEEAARRAGRILCVGFNRRYAPLTLKAMEALEGRAGPLVALLTVNAGAIPVDHWTRDPTVGGGRLLGEGCHFLDLARCLVGAPIQDLEVSPAFSGGRPLDDVALVQVRFADGSTAAIHYLANGSKAYPKERVELFWDGKILAIDNFRRMKGWGLPGKGGGLGGGQDKGHDALVAAFVAAVRGEGEPPIPLDELVEVSRWAIRMGEMGRGVHPDPS